MLGTYLEIGEYAFDMAVVILGVCFTLSSSPLPVSHYHRDPNLSSESDEQHASLHVHTTGWTTPISSVYYFNLNYSKHYALIQGS